MSLAKVIITSRKYIVLILCLPTTCNLQKNELTIAYNKYANKQDKQRIHCKKNCIAYQGTTLSVDYNLSQECNAQTAWTVLIDPHKMTNITIMSQLRTLFEQVRFIWRHALLLIDGDQLLMHPRQNGKCVGVLSSAAITWHYCRLRDYSVVVYRRKLSAWCYIYTALSILVFCPNGPSFFYDHQGPGLVEHWVNSGHFYTRCSKIISQAKCPPWRTEGLFYCCQTAQTQRWVTTTRYNYTATVIINRPV